MQQRKTDTFIYDLVRAKRKTMAMRVEADGKIVVRAPYRMPAELADRFVESHREWILKQQQTSKILDKLKHIYTEEEKKRYREEAKKVLGAKCRFFAEKMQVDYGRITIREQKTRWGSCSGAGNLNFNWKLVLMPEEIQDYLVVHELAHRREMNHGKQFWALVAAEIPDYKGRRDWLRLHGREY